MSRMSTGPMEWESSEVYGEPVSTTEFSVESIAGDVSDDSTDSSVSEVDDISYDSDEEFDESANQIDDCTDNIISDTFVEDLESQSSFAPAFKIMIDRLNDNLPESADDLEPQKSNDVALQEVLDRLDREQKIIDAEVPELVIQEINETIVMVCEDDTLEEDEISISAQIMADFAASELEDIEMQSSSEVVFTLEQQLRIKNWTDEVKKEEEKLFQAMFLAENEISEDPISGYGVYQSDSDQMIPHEIHGLGPKLSGLHKIWDWMSNCHFEIYFYADLISS